MGTSGNIAKQRAEHVLLEVPAIDGAADIVGDLPDLTLELGALLSTGHAAVSLLRNLEVAGDNGSLSAPNSTPYITLYVTL